MEEVNLAFLLLLIFILLLAHLQGGHDDDVGSVQLLLHLQPCYIATPLAGDKEEEKVDDDLDPEAVAVRKQTYTQEDQDWVKDIDDKARSDDQVDQGFPCIKFLPDCGTKERGNPVKEGVKKHQRNLNQFPFWSIVGFSSMPSFSFSPCTLR
eukprot:TRINITY_DN21634_c0_g1_i1.p1 TRINITY_DN21634_c0_g1~~TRINITY_DN21634_c0_g1_i1.p1  ORF type:complete len:152 (+),score=52.12 TRINITY_DN21634_c0_g1_i1:6-461(+)